MGKSPEFIPPPSLLQLASAYCEYQKLVKSPVFKGEGVPHGQGQTVIITPGYLESNWDTALLGKYLKNIGYDPKNAFCGINFGHPYQFEQTRRKVMTELKNGKEVNLLGHSLGGYWQTELAQDLEVNKVVTLGAPLMDTVEHQGVARIVSIHSPNDGVVLNGSSKIQGPKTSNIQVLSPNHIGLLCSETAFREVAKSLVS